MCQHHHHYHLISSSRNAVASITARLTHLLIPLLLLPLLPFLLFTSNVAADSRIDTRFSSATHIQHVLHIPQVGGQLVVGAVNHLYALNASTLALLQDASTGPLLDSPLCNSDLTSCIDNRASVRQTDTYNKILHYLPASTTRQQKNALLVCGSTRQGVCQLRSLDALQQTARHPNFPLSSQHVPVAANSPNASTVSFLSADGERLYVAATFSADSPYRENFPAVTTRLAPGGLLPINSGSLEGEAAVHVRAEYRQRFRIKYVGGFQDERYVYWAAVQSRYVQQAPSVANPLVTRLIRVCQDDDRYSSYSEIELQCRSGEDNSNFNVLKALVLFGQEDLIATFTTAEDDGKSSAVCVFSMAKVRLTFWYNIDRCRGGTDSIGLPHIGRDAKCINKSSLPLSEDTCQLGVGGTIEASALAALLLPDQLLTSVTAKTVENKELIVLGTSNGTVMQLEMLGEHNNRRLKKYAEYIVASESIDSLQFIDNKRFLVTSNKEMISVRVSTCSDDTSCSSCLSNRDPLCGWCLRSGQCMRQSECQQSLLLKKCPMLDGPLRPTNASIAAGSDSSVFIPVRDLPRPEDATKPYECFFGAHKSRAEWAPTGISCHLPRQKPSLVDGAAIVDHLITRLNINSGGYNGADILSSNFTFFNCGVHSVCSTCTSSQWTCSWCPSDHKCLNPEEACSTTTTADRCAQIVPSMPELIVADGSNASLSFGVINMHSNDSLSCLIQPPHQLNDPAISQQQRQMMIRVSATLHSSSRVHCSQALFTYPMQTPFANYTVELLTAHGERIDRTLLTLYKCGEMAADCSQCLALDPKFRCAWCGGGCKYHSQCAMPDQQCTQPIIESFTPKAGPLEGGTIIAITGRDLGSRRSDVQDRVMVGSSRCRVTAYEVSRHIKCQLEKGPSTGGGGGPIRITIGRSGHRTVTSKEEYRFVDPQPKSIYPSFGPTAGGTRLSIYGDHFNAGRNISIHLDNLPCQVIEDGGGGGGGDPIITCITSASVRPYTTTVIRVQMDAAVRLLHAKFTYRPNPTITSIDPLTSFESGGRLMTVRGTNFDSILTAKIFLLINSGGGCNNSSQLASDFGQCRIANATHMQCLTPKLTQPPTLRPVSTYNRWGIGFKADGVMALCNLGPRFQLTTVPDPQLSPFTGVKLQSADQPLIIQGSHLSDAATLEEYTVDVGSEPCRVVILDTNQLLCQLPETMPAATDEVGQPMEDGHPLVVVRVGSLRAEIGPIELEGYSVTAGGWFSFLGGRVKVNMLKLLLLLLGGLGVLGCVVLLTIWLWRRRGSEHERVYKRIQLQMEQMESSVRNECKQAFAELQVGMTDLTAAIDDVGIPFQERAEFALRLLFPGGAESRGAGYSSQLPIALAQFDSLLWNREFVFLLIHLAENDPSIGSSERSALASLLLVALSRNMPYCTDIVFSLLSTHIERHLLTTDRSNAHLLFRRSDSVVEKLFQQWLSISLYPYLSDANGPGRNLFVLYKALKYQTERGPIDCVTGEARYSLSEQKLLRESVEANQVILLVIPVEGFDQVPVLCRVLDCDSISQVKVKLLDLLYGNAPLSTRLHPDQFDLEWKCPKRGCILLLDDDRPHIKGAKRLNTVARYQLPNNALLAMQSRCSPHQQQQQHQTFTFRSGSSSDTTCSAWSSAHLLDGNSSCSPTTSGTDTQYYHLSQSTNMNGSIYWGKRSGGGSASNGHAIQQQSVMTRTIPEVFLTRLLMCKGAIRRFVEDFFESVMLSGDRDSRDVPIVLKYVLDFLDAEADRNNITDPEVLHAWKTNVVVLRFWMQLMHNPDCLFDVQRQHCLDASLSVIGQTLMDTFSRSDLPLGKESPSSKLLFAKEIARYRPMAVEMFRRVRTDQAPISSKQFYEYMSSMSKPMGGGHEAVGELLNWAKAHGLRLVELLEQDPVAVQHRLGDRLRQIVHCSLLEPEHIYATLQ